MYMFNVKFKDGTTIQATAVEEICRQEFDGKLHVGLTIQDAKVSDSFDLNVLKDKLTSDALSSVQVFSDSNSTTPINSYSDYIYASYMILLLQPDGSKLLDMKFTKENLDSHS